MQSVDSFFERSNLKWLKTRTIFLTRHGSHAYGLNTPTSDEDFKGIAIPPSEYFYGFSHTFEQAETKDPDLVIYDIRKFFKLARDCNPNLIELLWTAPEHHVIQTELGAKLIEHRDLFLSKKARHTFSGYALAQLKRINAHHRWLKHPSKNEPKRIDFGLQERPKEWHDQVGAALATINREISAWDDLNWTDLDRAAKIELKARIAEYLAKIQVSQADIFHSTGAQFGFDTNFLAMLQKEKEYRAAKQEWDSYQTWLATRNKDRAEIEVKYGYDCYAADTEFLTNTGWKKFDDINEQDELATVFIRMGCNDEDMEHRTLFGIEYQIPSNRFDALYNGPMYQLTGTHLDVLVTANHRMLYRKVERRSTKKYSWVLEEAAHLPDTFDIMVTPTPRKKCYSNQSVFNRVPIPDRAYMTLMGWYLSDGCSTFRDEVPKCVRISQIAGGKLAWSMAVWHSNYEDKAQSSLYTYEREPNAYNPRTHTEKILDVRESSIVTCMVEDCGRLDDKRIPRWVFGLSKRLMEILLISMIRGDGTLREHKTVDSSYIYYSSLKSLADDVQELGFMCGWETALWGPYPNTDCQGRTCMIYQVHLRREKQHKRLIRSANVERIEVKDQRVVCFTVPNGTLITRRNGKVGIHGNCKHAMHLVRLLKMCKEIMELGQVIVKRPDREELLAIRNGAWTYEQLVGWAAQQDKEMQELYEKSTLPHTPDIKKLDDLCMELVGASIEVPWMFADTKKGDRR